MSYKFINGYTNGFGDVHVVDLRSDTISKPTQEMREAMYTAEVGDSVYGEDPTVTELERRAAELLGKEDAVYVPSGTMANLLAIMIHCKQRGSELICGDHGHTFRFEQGGPSFIAGVQSALVKTQEDGTFDLDEVRSKIRIDPDCHEPITSLIVVENTHNMKGGKVLPIEWLDKLSMLAKQHQIPVHMDGARVMNAAVASKLPPSRIARDMDSICFCLSKGLGAPVGSLLCGTKSFTAMARRYRKALGGGMRQCGIVAAAGLVALDKMIDRLKVDHDHAYKIAKAIDDMKSDMVKVELNTVQTNILMVYLDSTKISATDFLQRLADVHENDTFKVNVRATTRDQSCVRFVLYHEITDEDVEMVVKKLELVILEIHAKNKLKSV
ncbi:PREDICTED: probable low-specificity L-threonine aldolase 2 [Nicrophorus vespilloides]|uniref:Probable low-specificity L-threonine aldolase 2 n=1 Tax=Nicrophorus vespilloides TaxID=110193 RepID=A0ABM1M1F4_NICVS|nr:PREDICTED: probable low-specificity L-threonine aldolase 2 [Nicrophorus vespilloides]